MSSLACLAGSQGWQRPADMDPGRWEQAVPGRHWSLVATTLTELPYPV